MLKQKYSVSLGFRLGALDDQKRLRIKAFWSDRKIFFDEIGDSYWHGSRGNRLANWYVFSPELLPTSLTITWLDMMLDCHLVTNTVGQIITEWDKAYLQLEMSIFESYMKTGDDKSALWKEFVSAHRRNLWVAVPTLGLMSRMSAKEKQYFLGDRVLT